jgi:hypothetical protein
MVPGRRSPVPADGLRDQGRVVNAAGLRRTGPVELVDEALPDEARPKALARWGPDSRTSLLLPSQAELVLRLISALIFIRPPGVDSAPRWCTAH